MDFVPMHLEDEPEAVEMIRRNMAGFDTTAAVLAATMRRLKRLHTLYQAEGCRFYLARDTDAGGQIAACVGLGPLHGLPISERIGEIRDLVVDKGYRGRGIGARLIQKCIGEAKAFGYQRLYLETNQEMNHARKLFLRSGFRPVRSNSAGLDGDLPCYFLLENLQQDAKA